MTAKIETAKGAVTFDVALTRYKSNVKLAMQYARLCSEMAIDHFAKTGDITYCQRFFDAMPANYERRNAFVKWLVAHSPAKLEKGKFSKDKSESASPFDVAKAKAKPFWEFSPETPLTNFSAADLIKGVVLLVKRFEGQHAADEQATQLLNRVKEFSATLGAPSNVVQASDSLDQKIEAQVKADLADKRPIAKVA